MYFLCLLNCFTESEVAQSCPTLCNPMDCSTLGLPVPHYLLELAQVHDYEYCLVVVKGLV